MASLKEQDEINRTCPGALVGSPKTQCRYLTNKGFEDPSCVGRDHQDCANPKRQVYYNRM